jgi:hypothetical protein
MTTHSKQNEELFEFIDLRIRELQYLKRDAAVKKYPPKKREMFRRQIAGRILELKHVKSVIAQHKEFEQINQMKGNWIKHAGFVKVQP